MRVRRQWLLLAYEWFVAIAGLIIGATYLHLVSSMNMEILVYFLIIGVVLESMPIPAGKVLSSLMPAIPITVLITQGAGATVLITLFIAGFAMALQRRTRKFSVQAFNVGQYVVSVYIMAQVHRVVIGPSKSVSLTWTDIFALILITLTFTVTNHLLVNLHSFLRDMFAWSDLRNFITESYYFLLTLPIVILMIALIPYQPLFAFLFILPILVLGQVLRMYRKTTFLGRIQQTVARLVSEFNIDKISLEVAKAATRLSYADVVAVDLLSDDAQILQPRVVYPEGRRKDFSPEGFAEETGGVIWGVLKESVERACEYVPDTRRDARVSTDGIQFRSMAIYPIRSRDTVHGAVVCYSQRPHAFSDLTEYVSILTGQFSVLLENAKLYERLQKQSRRDAATGLFNYRYFYEELARRLETAKVTKKPLSVAILDVDYFKKLNDTYGHLAGDEVLRSLAQLFVSYADEQTLVARYGGEEFVMVWNEDTKSIWNRMEMIRRAVTNLVVSFNAFQIQGMTISVGIAGFPQDSVDDRDLLARADSALYWGAKQRGRNRTALYVPEFDGELFVDKLTGLYTLHFATIRIREELEAGRRDWGAICFDVDHLAHINETFGNQVGNEILQQISGVIKDHVRHGELAYRFGSDEFVILLADVALRDVESVAKRLARAIAGYHFQYTSNVILSVCCRHEEMVLNGLTDATVLFDKVNHAFIKLHNRRVAPPAE